MSKNELLEEYVDHLKNTFTKKGYKNLLESQYRTSYLLSVLSTNKALEKLTTSDILKEHKDELLAMLPPRYPITAFIYQETGEVVPIRNGRYESDGQFIYDWFIKEDDGIPVIQKPTETTAGRFQIVLQREDNRKFQTFTLARILIINDDISKGNEPQADLDIDHRSGIKTQEHIGNLRYEKPGTAEDGPGTTGYNKVEQNILLTEKLEQFLTSAETTIRECYAMGILTDEQMKADLERWQPKENSTTSSDDDVPQFI